MKITSIRFANAKPVNKTNGVCGLCSVGLDNSIVIHGVKVKYQKNQFTVSLPERKVGSSDSLKSVVTFLNDDFKQEFKKAVLDAYFNLIEQYPDGYYM